MNSLDFIQSLIKVLADRAPNEDQEEVSESEFDAMVSPLQQKLELLKNQRG